ncbi:hypothetical protein [Prosthecobacter sp.]|jgi:hypothetical protein|uniref:hypothetical protein n=1 Tax=Prosthecobacter sp. TaxID=1965333 RepID=UPI0037CA4AAE
MKHFSTHSLFHPMLTSVIFATLVACHKKPSLDGTPPPQQTIHHEVIILMPPQIGKTVISSGAGQPPPKEVSTCP